MWNKLIKTDTWQTDSGSYPVDDEQSLVRHQYRSKAPPPRPENLFPSCQKSI